MLLPSSENKWIEYHDARDGYGLALPQEWRILPPEPQANPSTLTLSNFDLSLVDDNCSWSDNLAKLTLTASRVTAEQTTLDWIGLQLPDVEELEAVVNGRYAGYLVTIQANQSLLMRLTPTLIIHMQLAPDSAWQAADGQSILASLAAPDEAITLPTKRPASPVAVVAFCQESAILYAGPGKHFEPVGTLATDEALPLLGRSLDGRWAKLIYPAAPDGTAWAALTDVIITAGAPPIEPILVRPGNS
jgi:hypothetical protein